MSGFPSDISVLRSLIPQPSEAVPAAEATTASAGTDATKFSMEGHKHPRLTSAKYGTTDSNGLITGHMFDRTFSQMPNPIMSVINVAGAVAIVTSWLQDGSNNYIGCNVSVTKRSASTTTNTVTVVGIPVLNGLTTTTQDTPVPNQLVSIVMLQQSGA